MSFWQALKRTYRGSLAFVVACPLLALIPVVFELLQHGVEVHIGMYDSIDAAQAVEHDSLRMTFGLIKVAALMLPGYWVSRYLATGDARFAAAFDSRAVRLFLVFFLFNFALAVLQLLVLPQTATVFAISFVLGPVVAVLLAAWGVGAALGNPAATPSRSTSIMLPKLPWAVALYVVAMMPLMLPHYLFAALAILGPKAFLWPVLIVDSLLVGWLAALLSAAAFTVASRASNAAGFNLFPTELAAAE